MFITAPIIRPLGDLRMAFLLVLHIFGLCEFQDQFKIVEIHIGYTADLAWVSKLRLSEAFERGICLFISG